MERRNLTLILVSLIVVTISAAYYYTEFLNPSSSVEDFEVNLNPIDPRDLTVNEWLEDFEHLFEFVKDNYPYLSVKERTHGYNWLDLRDEFEEQIRDDKDNKEFLGTLIAAVQALQNRHTMVSQPSRVIANQGNHKDWVPFNKVFSQEVSDAADYWMRIYDEYQRENIQKQYEVLIVYDRGEYVIRNFDASWEERYGDDTIVTEVNGVPINEAVRTCYDSGYLDYDFKREKNYLWSITPWNFGADAVFTLRNSTGYIWEKTFATRSGTILVPQVYPSSLLNLTAFEDKSIAYIYIGDFGSRGQEHIEEILDFYPQIEDYEYLIIDIRGNTGGFYWVWIDSIVSPIIKEDLLFEFYNAYRTGDYVTGLHTQWLTHEASKDEFETLPPEVQGTDYRIYKGWVTINPNNKVDFNGEVIVLIDNMVFSASEGFSFLCKKYGFATLYGTPSGGDGLMFYPLYYVLPNSKLVIEFASSLGLDNSGQANEEMRTQPDFFFESAYANHNELLNYVIDELEQRKH